MPPKKVPELDVGVSDLPEGADGTAGEEGEKKAEYIKWSWQDELEAWAGSSSAQLKAARDVIRQIFIPSHAPPSFTKDEWQSMVMRHVDPHPSLRAELAVQMLTTVLVNDRKTVTGSVDAPNIPTFVAASIRCQRGEAANSKMFDLLEKWFKLLETPDGSDAELMDCIAPLWQEEGPQGRNRTSWRELDSRSLRFVSRSVLTREVIRWHLRNRPEHKRRLQQSIDGYVAQREAIEALPDLEPELAQTFEEMAKAKSALRSHTKVQQHMQQHGAGKGNTSLKMRLSQEGSTPSVKKAAMQEFAALEKHFHEMAADNEVLIELWSRMDLNSNGELGFNEVVSFFGGGYPLLANMPALRKAFDTVSGQEETSTHMIQPEMFRDFLANVFYYNKIFLAFDLLDTDRDHHISKEEWTDGHGQKFFQKFLEIMEIDWDSIAESQGKSTSTLSFNQVCSWYVDEHRQALQMFNGGPIGRGSLLNKDQPLPRMLDADAFCGLILHAAYLTRSGQGSIAMSSGAGRV
eukprot:m.95549 g.95549  ORF g.95549 m.95549 type:complete len:518 (-) comp10112_c0_seq1:128-1681(-)